MSSRMSDFDLGELQRAQRRQRIHQAHQVGGPERLDELRQPALQRDHDLRFLVDVVVVEKDREHAHVFTRGFCFGLILRTDFQGTLVARRPLTAEAHELQLLDLLRYAVLADLEVVCRQIGYGQVVPACDGDIDPDQLDARAEHRLLLRRLSRLLSGGRLLR